jgi:hypothetical protein
MKAESDTTVRVTLTPDEVKQALLDWVRGNYLGDEAPYLTVQGVDFQFQPEGEFAEDGLKTDEWPGETTLFFRVQRPAPPPPGGSAA